MFTVLEPVSPKSRNWKGWFLVKLLSGLAGGNLPLMSFPWLFLNGISLILGLSLFSYKESGPVELAPPPL